MRRHAIPDEEIHYDPEPELVETYPDDSEPAGNPAQDFVDTETGEIVAAPTYAQALALTEAIKGDIESATQSFLQAGAKLAVVVQQQAWKVLSRHSFSEYCELDLHLGESMASDLVRLHQLQVQFPDIAPRLLGIGISKARALLPHISQDKTTGRFTETPKKVDELVTEGETLSWRDLRDHLNDDDGNKEEAPREHKPIVIKCPMCQGQITVSRVVEVLGAKPSRNRS